MVKQKLGDAFATLLRERNETAVRVAEDLDIPVTTLRTWLLRNSYPPDGLRLLTERFGMRGDVADLQQRFDFKLARPYSKSSIESAPLEPQAESYVIQTERGNALSPKSWNFVERSTEQQALALLRAAQISGSSIMIRITGGPRTGKSTTLNYLGSAATEYMIMNPDLQSLPDSRASEEESASTELAHRFDRAIVSRFRNAPHLRKLDQLPSWLNEVKADYFGAGRVLLILDGVEHLPPLHYATLCTALFNLKNNSAVFSELRKVDFVYTYDPAVQAAQRKIHTRSRFWENGFAVGVSPLPERSIYALAHAILINKGFGESRAQEVSEAIESILFDRLCHGHPWLTQCCLSELQREDSLSAMSDSNLGEMIDKAFVANFVKLIGDELDGSSSIVKNVVLKKLRTQILEEVFCLEDGQTASGVKAKKLVPGPRLAGLQLTESATDIPVEFGDLRSSLLFFEHRPPEILTTTRIADLLIK